MFLQRIRVGGEWWQRVIFKMETFSKGKVQWVRQSRLSEVKRFLLVGIVWVGFKVRFFSSRKLLDTREFARETMVLSKVKRIAQ